MLRLCHCASCVKNELIANPYPLFEADRARSELVLVFDERVAAQCAYGCVWFGKKATCPSQTADSARLRLLLEEYERLYIIGRRYPFSDGLFGAHWRTYSTNEIHGLLLDKEEEFFSQGHWYAKSFIGGSCKICSSDICTPKRCRMPSKGRPPLESVGLDVLALLRTMGLEYQQPPREYFWRIGAVFY